MEKFSFATPEEFGIYLSCQDSLAYNLPILLPLGKKGDYEKASKALQAILSAHPGLQTRFFLDREGRLCKKKEEAPFSFPRVKSKEGLLAPFDVLGGPLYRFAFLKEEEGASLFADFHHIAMDGFSLKMFLDEFAALYEGKAALEPEEYTTFDDADQKEAYRQNQAFEEDRAYYENAYGSIDVDSSFIEDKKEEAVSYKKIRLPLTKLSDEAVAPLLEKEGIRRSSFFLSAYALALGQATFSEEVFFLTVWNGRSQKEKKSYGMFVRTLPIYVQGLGEGSVSEYLKKVDASQKEAIAHSAYSYSDLVSSCHVSAENLFAYQGDYYYHALLNGKDEEATPLPVKDGKEKTAIELFRRDGGFFADVEYRSDLYDEEMIRAFFRRFEHFALELLSKDQLEDIAPCDEVDEAINAKVNDKDLSDYDLDRDLLLDIEKHIADKKDSLAISAAGETITYGQLGEISDRICDAILAHGLKPNDVVSLLIGRNVRFPISAVSAIKAGVGYQPLDPGYPDERLDFMIQDADAKLLIADRGLEGKVPSYHGPILFTDEIPSLPLLSLPRPTHKKDDLFIMLYTSGSTGKPKGVELTRGNLSAYVQWQRKANGIDGNTRSFTYASFGFDASMFDIYGALTNGNPVFVIDEDMRLDLKRMDAFITENGCTFGLLTTQVGRQFVEMGYGKTLKTLTVGGEKLVPIDPPAFTLINGYGPTECTITITSFPVDRLYHRVPIGKGYPINKLYILDKRMRPLPFGVPGYLYCAGPQVGRGYKNRPEENAKAFLENPFEGGIWKKMYNTGDVVRMLPDGTMDFIGRKDGQIKIRGFRIEMSEVERVIRDFPGILDATVNAYPAASGGYFLCGYVVSDSKVDFAELKAFILERKPYYMCPEAFMQLDSIPLNQNGKVNKRVLPLPVREVEEVVPPANEKEKKILQIAQKVLGYEGISVTLSLFDAGLTSISSIKFITLFSEAMGMDLDTLTLREHPSIRELASLQGQEEELPLEKLDSYPLTKTQEGIYVETISHPGSTVYNIPLLYRLDPKVDLDRLEEAVVKAIENHPYLHSHLVLDETGSPRVAPLEGKVLVERAKEPSFPYQVLPFDLRKGPFYQARIHEGETPYLYLDTHHVASDGTSLAILLEDIEKAYRGEELTPEKKDGFQIGLAESKASKEEIEAQKAFYASYLDGVDCLSLPRKEMLASEEEKPMEEDFELSLPQKEVDEFLKKSGQDRNGFYNAVFAYALSKWNGEEGALFASIYSGRDSSSTSRSVTMMVKTLPLYASLPQDDLVETFLSEVGKRLLDAQGKTLYSFAEASHDFGVDAKVMFAYQGDGFLPDTLGGAPAKLIPLVGDEVKAPFSVDCLEKSGKISLHFEYSSSLYVKQTVTYFARLFEMALKGFLQEKKLSDIVLIDETTKKEMDVYNQTEEPILFGSYVDALVQMAEKNPDKAAVVGIDETLTYEELNARTNQVADYLKKQGIQAEDNVVVMVPRIANAYVAREGIMKCGACFVPVDPAYPDERILSIIEDSEAKAVLTVSSIKEEKKEGYEKVSFLLLEDALKEGSRDPFPYSIDPASLAYCIFTSGSTGKPKGVMIEHHSLANLISNVPHNYVADEYANRASVAVSLASFSFDLSIQEEFIPLANGLTVLIASEDEILNPVLLAKRMKKYGVDVLTTTPSYLNNVLDIEDVMVAFRDLKIIDLGAEALPASLVAKMRERGMNARIGNGYGPTEATVTCTFDVVDNPRITIGFPDNNVKTYIVDAQARRLPFGAVGELLIGGEGVARGYVHRPELNEERFIHLEGVYAYRSGDLARISYDGRIEFFGRKDNQVKLRGLRVELDEVENAIASYPGVSRAVAMVRTTSEEGQFLVGYYLSEEEIPESSLKEHIGKTLTPYMIPKVLMRLESLPLTPNGKVNKKALPEPTISHSDGGVRRIRLPKNDTQQVIFDIFKHVLGVEELSIDDDFFELGGTSLSASKVTMLALEKGLPIAYSDVFDCPTVLELAAHCLSGKEEAPSAQHEDSEAPKRQPGLEHNVIEEVDGVKEDIQSFSCILLTGATGFLGTHVLRELLEHSSSRLLLLVRGSRGLKAIDRLTGLLEYYFDHTYEEELARRVKIIESDVTSPDLATQLKDETFDLIINCAALVKHFANDDAIERVNLGGVKNLIEVALPHHARLVQVSTLSVAGENVDHRFPSSRRIHEFEIDFGQNVDNKYIHSKIQAELAIIEAVQSRGLDGKIIRVGNLMGRARDGEFQVNSSTNSFMNTIRAYKKLGLFPVSAADSTIDFSPIDEVAKTILLLSSTSSRYTLFHSANSHEVELGDVIAAMNDYGYRIDLVDDSTFQKALSEYIQDESRQMDVSSLISYGSSSSLSREYILSDNSFSVKALYRLGYKWPITDGKYLARSIASLDTLGFFE